MIGPHLRSPEGGAQPPVFDHRSGDSDGGYSLSTTAMRLESHSSLRLVIHQDSAGVVSQY